VHVSPQDIILVNLGGTSDSKVNYTLPVPDMELEDGLELSFADGKIKCQVIHTPGHSQVCPNPRPNCLWIYAVELF